MIIYGQSDENLMDWVKVGQYGALEELTRRYENKFLARAFKSTRNRATAEDVAQETIVAIIENCLSFDRRIARFSTWAYAILDNKIKMAMREIRKTRMNVSLSSVDEDRDDLLAAADTAWFEDCSSARLQKLREMVLKYLNPEEQLLYRLKEEQRLSYEQIAQREPFKSRGLKPSALKVRRMRYIQKLVDGLEMESYTFNCIKAKPKMEEE
ncbi:MAG: sigma-70 family RNA polymerase sigma factor [Planctomycetota bacterium]